MWQRKGRSPEEGRRPYLNCSLLLQKSITTVLRHSKTKRRPLKLACNAVILCPELLLILCSGKHQKSQSHLSFSHRESHWVVPLPWNWGEHSGETFPFSDNRNRPWIQKANYNLTVSSSQNIFVFLPSIFSCIFNLVAAAHWRWQAFFKQAVSPQWIHSFCKLDACVKKGWKTAKTKHTNLVKAKTNYAKRWEVKAISVQEGGLNERDLSH